MPYSLKQLFTFLQHYSLVLGIMLLACFHTACDSQKNFKPEHIHAKVEFHGKLDKTIASANHISAKLKDNTLLTKEGLQDIKLQEHENLLYTDSKYWLVANGCAGLFVIPITQRNQSIIPHREKQQEIPTKGCVVSASIKNNLIAGVLADNSLFLYDTKTSSFTFQAKEESIYAISSLNANPIILDTLVIFPTLDGRLNTIDIAEGKSVKNIIVNTEKFLNNIIYLHTKKDVLVSATHKRIHTLVKGDSYSKELEIRDIYFDGNDIYVLAFNGIIYRFDTTLATLKSVKLPYANLNGIIIKNGHLYTFENSGGYLIDVKLEDFSYEVLKLDLGMQRWFSKRVTLFYTQNMLYINKKFFDFDKTLEKIVKEK